MSGRAQSASGLRPGLRPPGLAKTVRIHGFCPFNRPTNCLAYGGARASLMAQARAALDEFVYHLLSQVPCMLETPGLFSWSHQQKRTAIVVRVGSCYRVTLPLITESIRSR